MFAIKKTPLARPALGDFIQRYMHAQRPPLTLRDLQQRMGLRSHVVIHDVIHGRYTPNAEFIYALAKVTGEPVDTLLALALGRPPLTPARVEQIVRDAGQLSEDDRRMLELEVMLRAHWNNRALIDMIYRVLRDTPVE